MEFQTFGDCVWKNLPSFVRGWCLYKFMEMVIDLVTSPIIEESGKFGASSEDINIEDDATT